VFDILAVFDLLRGRCLPPLAFQFRNDSLDPHALSRKQLRKEFFLRLIRRVIKNIDHSLHLYFPRKNGHTSVFFSALALPAISNPWRKEFLDKAAHF
jgi:hypothetical protein